MIPLGPFQEWIEKRVERYRRLGEEPGSDRKFQGHVQRVARELGMNERTLQRYRYEFSEAPRANVEEALFKAGAELWGVYPPEDFAELYEDEGELKPLRAMLQSDLLLRAHHLYDVGMTMPEVAKELFPLSGYASENSLAVSLRREFRHQGWPLRSVADAHRRYIGGDCRGWVDDRPCRRRPMHGQNYCYIHGPFDESAGHYARGRLVLLENGLDPRPLSEWIKRRAVELGCGDPGLGERWGLKPAGVWRLRTGRKGNGDPVIWVRRSTVERILEKDGTATIGDLYPELA